MIAMRPCIALYSRRRVQRNLHRLRCIYFDARYSRAYLVYNSSRIPDSIKRAYHFSKLLGAFRKLHRRPCFTRNSLEQSFCVSDHSFTGIITLLATYLVFSRQFISRFVRFKRRLRVTFIMRGGL